MFNSYMNPYGYNSMPTATQPYGTPMSPYFNSFNQPQNQNNQNVQQTNNNTVSQQPQQQMMNTNKIFVTGIEDVRNRMLPLNSKFIFVDNDKDLLYEKIVDNTGHFEVKTYEIREKTDIKSIKDEVSDNKSNYATKDDLELLQSEIKIIKDRLAKMNTPNQVNVIRKEENHNGTNGNN